MKEDLFIADTNSPTKVEEKKDKDNK